MYSGDPSLDCEIRRSLKVKVVYDKPNLTMTIFRPVFAAEVLENIPKWEKRLGATNTSSLIVFVADEDVLSILDFPSLAARIICSWTYILNAAWKCDGQLPGRIDSSP